MPTQTGTIWAQWVGYSFVQNSVHTYTLFPLNRDITAEAALALLSTPDEFAAFIRSETKRYAEVVKTAGLKPQ